MNVWGKLQQKRKSEPFQGSIFLLPKGAVEGDAAQRSNFFPVPLKPHFECMCKSGRVGTYVVACVSYVPV